MDEAPRPYIPHGERDRKIRTISKTVSWRIIGIGNTFFSTWLVTGNLSIALDMMLFRELVAIILHYCHERVWNSIKWGRFRIEKLYTKQERELLLPKGERERKIRTFSKTLTWRFIGIMTTLVTTWIITRNFTLSVSVMGVREIIGVVLYYIHERSWDHTRWGKFRLEKLYRLPSPKPENEKPR